MGVIDPNWFNPYARAAVLWSRKTLSDESRVFLGSLKAYFEAPEFTVAHGSPRRPDDEYLLTVAQFRDNMSRVQRWPLFVGHSHMPLCFRVRTEHDTARPDTDVDLSLIEDQQEVAAERRPYGVVPAVFNPGSVGQPRDQDRRACCALYDSERMSFRVVRLEYDIQAVQRKIREAGLPEFLALRLSYGQ